MCLMEFSGGGFWRGSVEGVSGVGFSGRLWRSFEEVSGGGFWRGSVKGVSGGGFWRGFSGYLWRGSFDEVSKGGF